MSRSIKILLLTALFAVVLQCGWAQNSGVVALKSSAMDHLFQPPIPWSGSRFSDPQPLRADRFYIGLGAGAYKTWQYQNGMDGTAWGRTANMFVGYQLAPVHSLELNGSWSLPNKYDGFMSFGSSYLFNITSFASRLERSRRWDVQYIIGAEANMADNFNVTLSNGLRVKYNLSPTVGLYVEPKASFVTYAADGGHVKAGDMNSSFTFGATIVPSGVVNSIEKHIAQRRERWERIGYTVEPLLAVKSNLMYDAASIFNFEVEVPIGQRYSVAGEWVFPWWCKDDGSEHSNRRRTQLLNGTLEGKYWFGDRAETDIMTGWFAGLYAGAGLYDFERKGAGYQGEFYVNAGVDGGYAHTINRRGNLRLEYSLSIGYVASPYSYYEANYGNDNAWHPVILEEGTFRWFGPTRVRVSLGWLLTHKRKLR